MVVFAQKWLSSCKSGCIWAKEVLFGQKWLYSGKVIVFGQRGCIRSRWLYSCKVVVFWQKLFYSGKVGCNWVIIVVLG